MAGQLQSIRTFSRDFFLNLIVSLLIAALFALKSIQLAVVSFSFVIILSMGYLFLKKYERFLKVLWSGAHGYYYSFPVEENKIVWENMNTTFKYLGISSYSILLRFKDWVESLPGNSSLRFYFLLMNPEAKALNQQIAHQKGSNADSMQVIEEADREACLIYKRGKRLHPFLP